MTALAFESFEYSGVHAYRFTKAGDLFSERWSGGRSASDSRIEISLDESDAVYLALVWRLMGERDVFGIPRFHREDAVYHAGEPFEMVKWEYEIGDGERAPLGEAHGFVRARSAVSYSGVGANLYQRRHEKDAGFFELPTFGLAQAVLGALTCDHPAELNLFGLGETRAKDVTAVLAGSDCPAVSDVIEGDEILVDLSIGVDAPNAAIVIQSHRDLSKELSALADDYSARIDRYRDEFATMASADDFHAQVHALVNLGAEALL